MNKKSNNKHVLNQPLFFSSLIKEEPKIVLPVAYTLTQKMSSFVRNIDFALDWKMLESGKALFR